MPYTIGDLGKTLMDRLVAAGIDSREAVREIDLIVQHVTGWTVAQQHLHATEPLSADIIESALGICEQRCKRVPLQYVLGEAWFMGLRFAVRPGVLIPRSDTETLVEVALNYLKRFKTPFIVDAGTGSGAIAVSLARLNDEVRVIALDTSSAALEIAVENARLNGVSDRIKFELSDWRTYKSSFKFHAIISNPPYIPVSQVSTLAPEVADHEPREALFGLDTDGLGFYRSFIPEHVISGGFIAVEVGHGQADAVSRIFESAGWCDLQLHYDLNKIPRVVSAFCP